MGKKTIIFINFFLFQALVVVFIGILAWTDLVRLTTVPKYYVTAVMIIFCIAVSGGSIFLVKEISGIDEKERQAERNKLYLEESLQLIDVLRAHRHDFLNHIQVIYGLAQMGKLERMTSYINELTDNMKAEADVGRLAIPELAAFLIKKASVAVNLGIMFEIDVDSDLANVVISPTEIVSVVGNLLDNAFYAVSQDTTTEGYVLFKVREEEDNYRIFVSNSGAPIPIHLREKIFEKNFTTKGEHGSGLGLYITKSMLEKKGGTLKLTDDSELPTCFEVTIPKVRTK